MRRAGAAVLALALTACPATTDPGPEPTAGAPPRGRLTIAYPAEPVTLDPYVAAGAGPATRDLARLLLVSPYRVEDGEPEAVLIDGEPVVETGGPFRVTVRLRDDATWSDGRPIRARDLVRSWRYARSRAPDGATAAVRNVRRLDAGRARITFRREPADWREVFGAGLGIVPPGGIGRTGPEVSGGPYVLRRWRRGLDMTFVANERAPGGAPGVRRLRVVFVPDATAALDLLRAGRVDALGPYAAADWQERLAAAGVASDTAIGTSWAGIRFDPGRALSSRAVRRAFLEAADLERIIAGLVQEEGEAMDALGPRRARARARLDAAGWTGSGVRARAGVEATFTIAVAAEDELVLLVANALKFQAERVGIRAELVPLATEILYGEWLGSPEEEAVLVVSRARAPRATDRVVPLYRTAVTLAARDGVTLSAAAGPDGAFARAAAWRVAV